MPAKIAIRNNLTGEIRLYEDKAFEADETSQFMWTDCRYACDCNRSLFFARSSGEPDPDDRECGMSKFSALYAEFPDGTRMELDDPS